MLGSTVAEVLLEEPQLPVAVTGRGPESSGPRAARYHTFDARVDSVDDLLAQDRYSWIINAIGVLKPCIEIGDAASIEAALDVNALFPYRLAAAAGARGQRVIQIETDGVFRGTDAPYDESSPHDAQDVYGRTKSLGEVPADNVVHLRCSILGRERRSQPRSLLERALTTPPGGAIAGFTGQRWNGVTTLHFARVCAAIVLGADTPSLQHVVPADSVTKAELLQIALHAFGRDDVQVRPERGPAPADRRLDTLDPARNAHLWRQAGYPTPPTIAQMIDELATYETQRTARDA
jgi:dTDP-4-dehydrorhamnose reductase